MSLIISVCCLAINCGSSHVIALDFAALRFILIKLWIFSSMDFAESLLWIFCQHLVYVWLSLALSIPCLLSCIIIIFIQNRLAALRHDSWNYFAMPSSLAKPSFEVGNQPLEIISLLCLLSSSDHRPDL